MESNKVVKIREEIVAEFFLFSFLFLFDFMDLRMLRNRGKEVEADFVNWSNVMNSTELFTT